MSLFSVRSNNNGITLLELMFYLAFMSMALYMATITLLNISKESKRITKKMEAVTLESELRVILSNPEVCTCNFKDFSFAIDAPYTDFANPIVWGCETSASPVVTPGSRIPGTQSSLEANKIRIRDAERITADLYKGTVEVTFVQQEGNTPLAPVRVPQMFYIDLAASTATTRAIQSCAAPPSDDLVGALNCSEGQYLGFDASGNPECKSLNEVLAALNCSANQILGVNASGQFECRNQGSNSGGSTQTCPCGWCGAYRAFRGICGGSDSDPFGYEMCTTSGWQCVMCGCT